MSAAEEKPFEIEVPVCVGDLDVKFDPPPAVDVSAMMLDYERAGRKARERAEVLLLSLVSVRGGVARIQFGHGASPKDGA